jgi:hypothetical protein
VQNLVWVWEADPPGSKPDEAGTPSDYFPGLLYADAIELRLSWLDARFPAGMVAQGAVGKPVGVELTGTLPSPEVLTNHAAFAWFLATPQADPVSRAGAWGKLLGDPHIAALAPAQ